MLFVKSKNPENIGVFEVFGLKRWSERRELNPRPFGPERNVRTCNILAFM